MKTDQTPQTPQEPNHEKLNRKQVQALREPEKDKLRAEAFALLVKGRAASGNNSLILSETDRARLDDLIRCGMLPHDPPDDTISKKRNNELREIARQRNEANTPNPEARKLAIKIAAAGGRAKTDKNDLDRFDFLMEQPGTGGHNVSVFLNSMREHERIQTHQAVLANKSLAKNVAKAEAKAADIEARVAAGVKKGNAERAKRKAANSEDWSDYVFRRKGDIFEIVFEGCKPIYVRALSGMTYIHAMLSKPNHQFDANELYQEVNPAPPEALGKSQLDPEACAYAGKGGSIQWKNDPQSKGKYIKALAIINKKLAEIDEDLKSPDLSLEQKEKLEKQKENLEEQKKQLRRALKGPRASGGQMEDGTKKKSRQVVTKCINKAIEAIAEQNSDLAEYLHKNIHTGKTFDYFSTLKWST